ncbi:MAG TPA: DUF4123 domain-containing protein [Terriglobales bacterium]|nr:DUF4123 domain-containing protein [Terriglobales bacterium]
MIIHTAATTLGKSQPVLPASLSEHSAPTDTAAQSAPELFEELKSADPAGSAPPDDAVVKQEPISLDQLQRFAAGGFLFALMDSTDQILIPHKAKLLGGSKAISLFTGTAKEQYWQVAPYLFHVDPELLRWMVAKLWKEPWGIFALSKAGFEDLRLHFKKFLLAQLPDGKVWFFRYYDPRILKTYLPVCQPWELEKFFGPVRAFAVAGGEEEKPMIVQGLKNSLRPPGAGGEASLWWKIRPEQQQQFKKSAETSFVNRCAQFLRDKLPEQAGALPYPVLRQRVEVGIARAQSYGVTWRSSLLMFVTLMFELGPTFDLHPSIRPLLQDTRVRPDNRVKHIVRVISPDNARRIAEDANPKLWDQLVRSGIRG